ncbi:hypothetical protein PFISCL1PPCAC_2713 [Pristionchus fissidentatus]|uniref:Poly [ADP-ribose] polymerase n=1 Tax=Pristionchus fissidentatus TaxID=1538716 RepID=A0AAV5UVX0_9BILA|nr:hypothetical protein PFISCL1PPCAC_2713 [Pristionchus fissidentatus]
MDYEWYEDSDTEQNTEEEPSSRAIKTEPADIQAIEAHSNTITLSSDSEEEKMSDHEMSEEEEVDSDDGFDMALVYEKISDDLEADAKEHEYLKADVKEAAKTWHRLEDDLCIPAVQIEPCVGGYEGTCSVVLTLNVSDLPEMIHKLWELGTAMTVAVVVDGIHKREFRAFDRRPICFARKDNDKPSKFPVGECLINVVKPLITNTYSLETNLSPAVTGSFFSMIYEQLMERLRTLTEFCMVCGAKLYAGGLLPSICDGELCQYQYQELGLLEGLSTPRVSAPVLSLLLIAFNAAVTSTRTQDILTPAPSARDREGLIKEAKQLYKKINRKFVHAETGPYDVHSLLVPAMPCALDILTTPSAYKEFKKTSPNVAEFVEWLVISNQSYLEVVPPKLNVDYLQSPTQSQFLFVADTPTKQAEFDQLVQQNGGKTRFLYHGSKTENWHSIIRTGLKNMSGTKYQLVGAVHGAGIYLSNNLATSFHYCTRFDDRFLSDHCVKKGCCLSFAKDQGMVLLAVVEVVDTPAAYRFNQENIVVVMDEKWCSIRMLVAYPTHRMPTVDLNKMTSADKKKIRDVVHMFKTADLAERVKHESAE